MAGHAALAACTE